ncbi:UPF0184 protein [Pseudolycoriella hygida]|uniref:UPF0184 protein n=1 Tax=Pseudolycoriella hygida TaxID=35572 RepID=A0A9Q0MSK8_9DIPT|nr:UPF0184 protein [Pseudolycoriella hygida]
MSDQKELDQEHNNMSPKSGKDDKTSSSSSTVTADTVEQDLNEIDSVDSNLDSINTVLDFIEQRTDNIRAQLLELLTSSREIRQSIIEENSKTLSDNDNVGNKNSMDMP